MTAPPSHLHAVRGFEVDRVLALMPAPRGRLLEIGAGDGFQASILAHHFAEVCAIDVPPIRDPGRCLFPVTAYDGVRLPYPDASFDVVFSSNVLEHIAGIESFQAEILRVLRPHGRAAHIMPSASWRLWTLITHYLALPARLLRTARDGSEADAAARAVPPAVSGQGAGGWRGRLLNALIERRHGERGTTLGEFYRFSRTAWRCLFERNGVEIERIVPLGLFYSGYALFGRSLGIAARQRLARWFGSSTILYVVKAPAHDAQPPHRAVADRP